MKTSAEQKARDMLERMGIDGAQNFTAGLIELANLIADRERLKSENEILSLALRAMSSHLDRLVGECLGGTPSHRAIMDARGCLPPY